MNSLFSIEAISTRLVANADQSLAKSGFQFADIMAIVEDQTDEYEDALLTSSSVQGLATPKSDIDIICITGESVQGQRASAQIFRKDRRFEIILFSKVEIDAALDVLTQLNCRDLPKTMQAIVLWDRNNLIRFKYFERLINGVSFRRTTPFIEYLPKLAEAWRVVSYGHARQFITYALLAERAGERRSPTVYALKAIVQLMDVMLSRYGSVYTNPKWYLLRWKHLIRERADLVTSDAIFGAVEACWPRVLRSFELGVMEERVTGELLAILTAVEQREGFDAFWAQVPSIFGHTGDVEPFSGNEGIWMDPSSNLIVAPNFRQALAPVPTLSAINELDPDQAGTLLRAARARLADFSIAACAT